MVGCGAARVAPLCESGRRQQQRSEKRESEEAFHGGGEYHRQTPGQAKLCEIPFAAAHHTAECRESVNDAAKPHLCRKNAKMGTRRRGRPPRVGFSSSSFGQIGDGLGSSPDCDHASAALD